MLRNTVLLIFVSLLSTGFPDQVRAQAAIPAASGMADLERRTMHRDDREREYFVYTPKGEHNYPLPLLLTLHGGNGKARHMRRFGFEPVADDAGIVLVYPQGWSGWADGRQGARILRRTAGANDVGFLRAVIKELINEGIADPARIYVTGVSNGGFMSFRLACELPLAAIAPQIASLAEGFIDNCQPEQPVPLLMINGTHDRLIPYNGGPVAGNINGGVSIAVDETIHRWREINGCADTVSKRELADTNKEDNTTVTEFSWNNCRENAAVKLYRVNNGGHHWHGYNRDIPAERIARTGPVSRDFEANRVIWDFLKHHTKPNASWD